MILKYLWIEEYKKFNNIEIKFNTGQTSLEKELFENMKLTVLIGENGSGKTTILSFISHVFRNLERYHERIPCNFILKYSIDNNEIEIRMENELIYFIINNNKHILMKTIIKGGKELKEYKYKINEKDSITQRVNYDEISEYIPCKVVVSAFDIDYPKNYTYNYIGKRIYKISSIDSNYRDSTINMGISLGVFRFLKEYFSHNSKLEILMKKINCILSNNILIYRNYFSKNYISEIFNEFYEEYDMREWNEFTYKAKLGNKDQFINLISSNKYWNNFCGDLQSGIIYDDSNEYLDINKYIKSNFYNEKVLEIMIDKTLIYINNFFIIKGGKEIPLSNMSTGEKMFLCRIFFILSEVEDNSIIILEEPEIHLNHAWVKQIVSIITLLFNKYKIHFIISTHNYAFINNLFKENLLLVNDDEILEPKINTFLANEKSISLELFGTSKNNNIFEDKILKIIGGNDKESIDRLIDVLGESYYKFLAFKRLSELEEKYVEDKE